jgi:hypothetical protein
METGKQRGEAQAEQAKGKLDGDGRSPAGAVPARS